MKSKREVELEKCLEKTLEELRRNGKLHARICKKINHYYLFTSKQFWQIQSNIQRTLKNGGK